jgi:hypothetical protein
LLDHCNLRFPWPRELVYCFAVDRSNEFIAPEDVDPAVHREQRTRLARRHGKVSGQ